jgi:general secretion pathway protein H
MGFTLLELMVVMAILAMLTVILPVAFDRTMPGRRVETTAQRIAAAVRDARSASVATGRPVELEFGEHTDLTRGGIRVVSIPAPTQVRLVDSDGRRLRVLVAYPDGSMRGGRFEVSERVHHSIVAVSGTTGRVELETGDHER